MNISIAGNLGSGKSTIAKILCNELKYRYFSTGSMQRQIADEMGINTLELNYISENDRSFDDLIDQKLKDINNGIENYVLDSRLAWHFVPNSLKVFLIVSPYIAAERVINDKERVNEPSANDLDERVTTLVERQIVENRRFKSLYDVDCMCYENYDLIIDTSHASPQTIASIIIDSLRLKIEGDKFNKFWLSPKSLYPTENIRSVAKDKTKFLIEDITTNGFKHEFPVDVVSYNNNYFIWDGHKRVSSSIICKLNIIPVNVISQNNNDIHTGHSGKLFVESSYKQSNIYDWEDAHSFRFSCYLK